MRHFCLAAVLVLAQAPFLTRAARADASESEDDRKAAAKLFAEAQKAYKDGDYRHAAEAFEGAYKRAPRLPPLWNAARAWQKGGELVRAANLYASYLRKAPPTAPDRNSATSALRELETRLARLELHAPNGTDLKLDGVAIELDDQNANSFVVYATPGTHVFEGQRDGKNLQERTIASAGASTSVVLLGEHESNPPPRQPPLPPQTPVEKPHSGWSPIVVAVGGGVTAVLGGFLIWSGVDTMSQRSTFDANPTQGNLDAGKSDQLRTNVFVGVTVGVGVLTGLAAIFLVDWKGSHASEHAHLRFGVGSVGGTF